MHQKQRQMSETFRLGALLTVVGGFLDTYTYLSRGGVFANAQTGNIVLLGLSLAQGNYEMLLHYLIPILAFAAGAMMYVVTEELIPQTQQGHHTNIGTIGVAFGFVLMMVLDVALG